MTSVSAEIKSVSDLDVPHRMAPKGAFSNSNLAAVINGVFFNLRCLALHDAGVDCASLHASRSCCESLENKKQSSRAHGGETSNSGPEIDVYECSC